METSGLKLILTTVTETAVRMRYADHADPALATTWLDYQVPLETVRRQDGKPPLLAEVQVKALLHARGIIGAETRVLEPLADRNAL
ncbi:MAG: hypothetical protein K8F90_01640 [Hyphomicrobiales bacterium]|nr:hypothetical protein [Hyphomicrobiales bacterium]